jgi:hypothetical protein
MDPFPFVQGAQAGGYAAWQRFVRHHARRAGAQLHAGAQLRAGAERVVISPFAFHVTRMAALVLTIRWPLFPKACGWRRR